SVTAGRSCGAASRGVSGSASGIVGVVAVFDAVSSLGGRGIFEDVLAIAILVVVIEVSFLVIFVEVVGNLVIDLGVVVLVIIIVEVGGIFAAIDVFEVVEVEQVQVRDSVGRVGVAF